MAAKKIYLALFFVLIISNNLFAVESSTSTPSNSKHPLFEWGILLGHGMLPDYPSSNEYRYLTLPSPYISYHGDFFETGEQEGTRFKFISNTNFDFDLSFGGSFPTETNENQARSGMPNLDWTLEVGPRILYYFYRNSEVGSVRVGLPLRSSFSTNFTNFKHVGYLFSPTVQVDFFSVFKDSLDLYVSLTGNYLSEGEADFFYEITPEYSTPERQTYDARSGLLNSELAFGFQYEWNKKIILVGVQYTDSSQSANRDSFLHKSNYNWSYLIAFGWILFQSDENLHDR